MVATDDREEAVAVVPADKAGDDAAAVAVAVA